MTHPYRVAEVIYWFYMTMSSFSIISNLVSVALTSSFNSNYWAFIAILLPNYSYSTFGIVTLCSMTSLLFALGAMTALSHVSWTSAYLYSKYSPYFLFILGIILGLLMSRPATRSINMASSSLWCFFYTLATMSAVSILACEICFN